MNELIEMLEQTAYMLRGMTLDPAIPAHAKDAMRVRIEAIDALAADCDAVLASSPEPQSWPKSGSLSIECDPERFGPTPWHVTDGHSHGIGATPNEALSRYLDFIDLSSLKRDAGRWRKVVGHGVVLTGMHRVNGMMPPTPGIVHQYEQYIDALPARL